jgi:hypothetical protein
MGNVLSRALMHTRAAGAEILRPVPFGAAALSFSLACSALASPSPIRTPHRIGPDHPAATELPGSHGKRMAAKAAWFIKHTPQTLGA